MEIIVCLAAIVILGLIWFANAKKVEPVKEVVVEPTKSESVPAAVTAAIVEGADTVDVPAAAPVKAKKAPVKKPAVAAKANKTVKAPAKKAPVKKPAKAKKLA
jgi:hypothetical protein